MYPGYSLPLWYQCDPQTCSRPDCQCASIQSPLPIEETPQFILLSNDDSVSINILIKFNLNIENAFPYR